VAHARYEQYYNHVIWLHHDIFLNPGGIFMSGTYGGNYGNSVGIILVLFILLVIILSVWV